MLYYGEVRKNLSLLIIFSFFLNLLIFAPFVHAENKIVINEFLIHPSSGNKEWVELYNPDSANLSGYWIDDDTDFTSDSGNSSKKSLSTIINSNSNPYIELSSMLNNDSDHVVLFDTNGNIIDQYEYTSDPGEDVPIGRYPDGTGSFQALAESTKGNINSMPAPTPSPTPSPTPVPPKEPTPTKTPTSSPTKIPTISPSKSATISAHTSLISSKSASLSAGPTSILGANIKSSKKKPLTPKTLINSSYDNKLSITMIIGSVFILSCAIIAYLTIRKRHAKSQNH